MNFSYSEEKMLDRFGLAFFAAAMIAIALLGVLRPMFNWDMIPYVALAEERAGANDTLRHDRAYQLVRAAVPAKEWAQLTESDGYRSVQYMNAQAFDTQLGMYRIKVGYIAAARVLSTFFPTVMSYRLINVLALMMLLGAVMWWMIIGHFGRTALFLVPVLLIARLPLAARLITPDLLCTAFAIAGLALLRRGPWPLAAICFAATTVIRPDFILFPGSLFAVALVKRCGRKEAGSCFAAATAAYATTTLIGHYPGWWPYFSQTLIEYRADMHSIPPFSLAAYLHALTTAMATNIAVLTWPALVMLLAICWLQLQNRDGYRPPQGRRIFVALMLSLAGRCIVFPITEDRLYLPTVVMLALMVVERWAMPFREARTISNQARPQSSISPAYSITTAIPKF